MIGDVIRDKRKELGLTQAQLAERLGVTAPAVNRWEKGLGYPDITLLAPLARLLNTDMNVLFSFYQSLSDTERSLLEKRAFSMIIDGHVSDALQFMDEQLHLNAADGQLYWAFAKTLMSSGAILKKGSVDGYLDRTIDYYEKALELLPEATENIAEALVALYGERGDREKAENVLALIPERRSDRKWSHAELMYKLGQYEDAASEAEESILRKAIELIPNLSFLYAALSRGGHDDLAQIARNKSVGLQDLFELWSGFSLINILQDSELSIPENNESEEGVPLSQILDVKTAAGGISRCPLFKNVALGNAPMYEPSIADAMSDVMNALKKYDDRKHGC